MKLFLISSLLDDAAGAVDDDQGDKDCEMNEDNDEENKPGNVDHEAKSSQGRVKKRAFGCSQCSSRFYTQESLAAHERVHAGKKPFVCPVCSAELSSKNTLKIHMRAHSGEKPFSCNVSGFIRRL